MVTYLKVAGKFVLALAAGVAGAELGFAGGAGAVNDAVAISGVGRPKVVATKGFGPFKKAVVATKNPFTGKVTTTTVKVKTVKAANKKTNKK